MEPAPEGNPLSVRMPARGMRRSDVALMGVYEISKLLTAPLQLEARLAGVLHLLASFLDMRHGLIALLGADGTPEVVVGSGWTQATAKRYFERLPERAIGRIVVTRMPLVVEHMKQDALFESWDFSEWGAPDADCSFIGVPIKDRGNVIGTVTVDRERSDAPYASLDEDVRLLTMIANLLGQTVRLQCLVARDRERLMDEQRRLEKTIEREAKPPDSRLPNAGGIIGNTPAIRSVLEKVRRAARGHTPVLLRGESGTGKEMFARVLHDQSSRHKGPFVAVNCAALSESLLESELFGHEKGAFTGAVSRRKGRFELADHGTLFLDEIGEISPAFQAKLLRVLQLGEFERIGGSETVRVDVRVVCATNRNLEESVAKGTFRFDLYYRVNVVPIVLPPLRERREDIPLLADEFLRRFNAEHETSHSFTDGALAVITSCCFPGNVRELENCVRRTATMASDSRIVADDFACRHDECMSVLLWNQPGAAPGAAARSASSEPHPRGLVAPAAAVAADLGAGPIAGDPGSERERLIRAMERAGWVQAKAARLLGLTARQIGYALRKHKISMKKF